MSNVSQWSTSPANNNDAPPDGWPEGQSPSSVNNCARENMAALAKWYKDTNGSVVTAGSSNAYTLTTNNSHAALADQSLIVCEIDRDNTGNATLNVDGLGAKSWVLPNGSEIPSGGLKANSVTISAYESDNDNYILLAGYNVSAAGQIIESTDAGASAVTGLDLYRNSTSPADDDEGVSLPFSGENDNDEKVTYAELRPVFTDVSDGDEDGALQVRGMVGGSPTTLMQFAGTQGLALKSFQTFTGDDTWNRTAGVTRVLIEVQGPGGGGGGAEATSAGEASAGAGGGGGGYARKFLDVSSISSSNITVGSGGNGGSGNNSGNSGGNSSWADGTNTVMANGGGGGGRNGTGSGNLAGSGAGGGSASGGDINMPGGGSDFRLRLGEDNLGAASAGGDSVLGKGGAGEAGISGGSNGNNGGNYGGGGGGAFNGPGVGAKSGGDGADGVVIVWEFG